MTIRISAFRSVPAFAQGHVRDLRVRWALEEAGLPHEVDLLDHAEKGTPGYRAWQPFGQVPAYRDDEVEMFESGAIVLHLAGRSEALAPRDAAGLARVGTWVFAALNTVEPSVAELGALDVFHAGQAWTVERRPALEEAVNRRLADLAASLGDRDWLEGRFTAGDLMMVTVLRSVAPEFLARHLSLAAYRRRGEARPAFVRALEAQMRPFREARQAAA